MKFLLASLTLASATACPGSSSYIHAKCDMDLTFTNPCSEVKATVSSRMSMSNGFVDPHNKGTYSVTSESMSAITGQRVTGDKKYTDKFDFNFVDTANGGCKVDACSESQVMSVLDYSTNYCNLHNLYAGLTVDEKYSSCSQHDVSACGAQPSVALRGSLKGGESCPAITTQSNFDQKAYASGKWYIHQQAVTKYLPAEQNFCVTAGYEVKDKATFLGWTITVNNHAEEVDGKTHDGNLCAAQADPKDPAKLEVAPCFLPKALAGPYWVLNYDESEGYALVAGGQPTIWGPEGCKSSESETNGSGLWIFTRSQTRDEALVNKVRNMAKVQGFDLAVLNDVDQTKCAVSAM